MLIFLESGSRKLIGNYSVCWFSTAKRNIEITCLDHRAVVERQANIHAALDHDLNVLGSFLAGSYVNHTMIAPLAAAHVDMFTVLDPRYYYIDSEEYLLRKVKRVLTKNYPKTPEIDKFGRAVRIKFTDFTVDVVPAFLRKGGGYLFPNIIDKVWIITDPKTHWRELSDQNLKHNGNLIPIIKMIKCWNRNIGYSFESFYLELTATEIFKNLKIADFPSAMTDFFYHAKTKIRYHASDPAGYNGYAGGFRNASSIYESLRIFERAYATAKNADEYAHDNKVELAVGEWQKVFGYCFPFFG